MYDVPPPFVALPPVLYYYSYKKNEPVYSVNKNVSKIDNKAIASHDQKNRG